jgi:hypothetical protein
MKSGLPFELALAKDNYRVRWRFCPGFPALLLVMAVKSALEVEKSGNLAFILVK